MECCSSLRYNNDHNRTFFQGYFFPPGVAAVNDGAGSSVVCGWVTFCREDGRREMVGDLEAGYYRGRN